MSFVDSAGLQELAEIARAERWIGLDVEFASDRTYFAKLALVQASAGERCVLIDPVRRSPDMAPLAELLADPQVVKVLHSPDQDLPILSRALDVPTVRNVFDTQIAAAVAGVGDGAQIGYAWLVEEFTGVELPKGARRTDWLRRPLSPTQIEYALDDVRHLRLLWERLLERLRQLDRVHWVQEDCLRFEAEELYRPDPLQAWKKVKGASGVNDPDDRAVLQELAAWREKRAERADRPRRWLVEDRPLIDLSRTHPRPSRPSTVAQIAELTERQERQWAREMTDAIARGEQSADPGPAGPGRLTKSDEARARRLMEAVKVRALELEIAAPALATANDARAIALHGRQADARALTGWRRQEIGERLLGAVVEG